MENTETMQMLAQIPALASVWDQMNVMYDNTIRSNSLAQYTLSKAESALSAVGSPFASRIPRKFRIFVVSIMY